MHSLPKIISSATSATERSTSADFRRVLLEAALVVLALSSASPLAGQEPAPPADPALVRVQIFKTFVPKGPGQAVQINGQVLPNYRPTIIQAFPSSGIVLDEQGHVLAFLGYRWVELHGGELRIEIIDPSTEPQRKLGGKLIGIDQSTGVAVVRAGERGLRKTRLCIECAIEHGATVVAPMVVGEGGPQFERAKIVGVSEGGAAGAQGWHVRIDRRLSGIGEPLLDVEHRVLGFITAQRPSTGDNVAGVAVVYPISQLLTSAEKIIQAGGDIETGWLGVYVDDLAPRGGDAGVRISGLVAAGPASKAGLERDDVVVRCNGQAVRDAREFIRLVQETKPGHKIDLAIVRAGKDRTLQAVVGTRRPEESRALIVEFPEVISFPDSRVQAEVSFGAAPNLDRPLIGAEIVPLTPQLAGFLEIPTQSGLLVSAIAPNMPAALAGVRVGDVILTIDGNRIFDPLAFVSHIQSRGWGSIVVLKYLRKKTEHIARVTLKRAFAR